MDREDNPVLFYEGTFYCFSNFASFAVFWRGEWWMTSEHAYQAAKFDDPTIRAKIREAKSAHDAKVIAHTYDSQKRPNRDKEKIPVMEDITWAKLMQHSFIQKQLLQTNGRYMIEDSPKDAFWGRGPDHKGRNELGKIWMRHYIRLRSGQIYKPTAPH